MTYLNINLKLEELTEAVLNSDMNTLMKSLAITVFNAYMEEERHQFIQAAPHERSDLPGIGAPLYVSCKPFSPVKVV